MKKTVRSVAEAQAIIQQIAPASYQKEDSSLALGAKAKDRVEWYNAENSSYCLSYKNGEVELVNVFDAGDELIATITIDNNAEVEEYAVSVEAQEIAMNAEIDAAKENAEKLNPFSKFGDWYKDWARLAGSETDKNVFTNTKKDLVVTKVEEVRAGARVQAESVFTKNALVVSTVNSGSDVKKALVVFYFNPQGKPAAFVKTLKTDSFTQYGRGGRHSHYEVNERLVFNKYVKADRLEYALAVFDITVNQLTKLFNTLNIGEQATLTYNKNSKVYKVVEADGNEENAEAEIEEVKFEKVVIEAGVDDDGSNDDSEEDSLTSYADEISEDDEDDELIDEAEPVQEKIYFAKTYIGYESPRSSEKEFKSAVAAFKYLKKKVLRYAATTYWNQAIEVWDGKRTEIIYEAGECYENGEWTNDTELQALIDAADAEMAGSIAAGEINNCIAYWSCECAATPEAQEVAVQAEIDNATSTENTLEMDLQAANNIEDTVEVEIEDYAVSVEAQGIAIQAEIDNAFGSIENKIHTLKAKISDINDKICSARWGNAEGDIATLQAEMDAEQAALNQICTENFIVCQIVEVKDVITQTENYARGNDLIKTQATLQELKTFLNALYQQLPNKTSGADNPTTAAPTFNIQAANDTERSAPEPATAEFTVKYRVTVIVDGKEDNSRYKLKSNSHAEARQLVRQLMNDPYFEAALIEPPNGFNSYHVYKPTENTETTVANFAGEIERLVHDWDSAQRGGNHTPAEIEKQIRSLYDEYQSILVKTTLAMEPVEFDNLFNDTVDRVNAQIEADKDIAAKSTVEYKTAEKFLAENDLEAVDACAKDNLDENGYIFFKIHLQELIRAIADEDYKHIGYYGCEVKRIYEVAKNKTTPEFDLRANNDIEEIVTKFEVGKTYLYKDVFEGVTEYLKVIAREEGTYDFITVEDSHGAQHTFEVTPYKIEGNITYINEFISVNHRADVDSYNDAVATEKSAS